MPYEFDVFISYKRDAGSETLGWIERHFVPLLSLHVGQELGGDGLKIFVDKQVEVGASWPEEIGRKLGRSKILIALWSKNYFDSKWCTLELALMLAREKSTRVQGLIVPAVIHDGKEFPAPVANIQKFEIQNCFNTRMTKDSKRAEELEDALKQHAPAIAAAIEKAPRYRRDWADTAADAFQRKLLNKTPPSQRTRPRYTQ